MSATTEENFEELALKEVIAEVFKILDDPKKDDNYQAFQVALGFLKSGLQLDCMPGLSGYQKKHLISKIAESYFEGYQHLSVKARLFVPRAMALLIRMIERDEPEFVSPEWGSELLEALSAYKPGAGQEWVAKQLSSPFLSTK